MWVLCEPNNRGAPAIISEVSPIFHITYPEHSLLLREQNSVRKNSQQILILSTIGPPPPTTSGRTASYFLFLFHHVQNQLTDINVYRNVKSVT